MTLADGTTKTIPKFKAGLLNCFRSFCDWRVHEGLRIKDDEWVNLTKQEFNDYRGSRDATLRIQSIASGALSKPSSGHSLTPLDQFRKGVR
jgi:hypothetical protein